MYALRERVREKDDGDGIDLDFPERAVRGGDSHWHLLFPTRFSCIHAAGQKPHP